MSEEKYRRAKEQIRQLEAEIAEFQESSRELEAEMEQELEESERKIRNLELKTYELTEDRDEWKKKYSDLQKELVATQASLSKQISSLELAHKQSTTMLREIEMENDDMERNERITKSTLEDIETKYYESLEEIAMLEAEVASKDRLQADLQRTRDELRETKDELAIALKQADKYKRSSINSIGNKENRTPPQARSGSAGRFQRPVVTAEAVNGSVFSTQRLASSRSLRKIHGMIDQLESRVATFKSSLPSLTPTKGSPAVQSNDNSPNFSPDTIKSSSNVASSTKSHNEVPRSHISDEYLHDIQSTPSRGRPIIAPATNTKTPVRPTSASPSKSHRLSLQNSSSSLYTLGHKKSDSLQHRIPLPTPQERRGSNSSTSPPKLSRSLSRSPAKDSYAAKAKLGMLSRQKQLDPIDGSPSGQHAEKPFRPRSISPSKKSSADKKAPGVAFSSLHSRIG